MKRACIFTGTNALSLFFRHRVRFKTMKNGRRRAEQARDAYGSADRCETAAVRRC